MIEYNYSVRTVLRKHTTNSTISFVIRWNKKRQELWLSTGIQWDPAKWDSSKGKARNNTTTVDTSGHTTYARDVNSLILLYFESIEKAFKDFKNKDKIPSADELRESIYKLMGNVGRMATPAADQYIDTHKQFETIYKQFMSERAIEKNWTKSTRDKNSQMWKCLNEYNPRITLGMMNRSTLNGLKKWYFDHGYHNTTVAKRFRDLKSFLNWLDRNGYPVNKEALQFDSNVPKSEKVITYLTLEELRHFASFPLKQQYLRNARDIFCFMCYTSLRYSDTAALKKSSISDGFIHVFTQKTKAKLDIPIIKDAQEILDNIMSTPGEYVFKAPSNQKLNDFIKLAAKEAKLDRKIQEMYYVGNEPHETYKPIHEIISCHMARRTFVVCSLALGIPVEVVKACTGHSTYEAMKPYIAIDSSTTKTYMEKWNVKTTRLQILKKIERLSSSQMMQLDNFLSTLLGDAPVNT